VLSFHNIKLNQQTKQVWLNDIEVVLSPREIALLELLLHNKNRVLSKQQLEEKLYSWDDEVSSNAIEVHVHHIRKKLGKDIIKTINKIGYMMEEK
ncbi:MAG: winged helix-turn-helix domain-containing protein, partial [Alphaproteobacteria bacterium]|nr:winged helix-turn-helix domain-containing protein [Alphaproteobacteria bacterium]